MHKLLLALLAGLLTTLAFAAPDPDYYRDGDAPPATVSIGRMLKPPVLDGALGDWPADATAILLGQNTQTGRRFAWGGTRDCSGGVRLAWDENYLYLGADVTDDRLDQATGGAEVWQGDTLELFFNTHPRQQRTDGFWQEAIIPPLVPGAVLRATGPQKDFVGVDGTAQVRPTGYTLECRIPWKNFPGFTPAIGAALGFQVYIDDRDGSGRKSQLFWYPSALSFAQPTHTNIVVLREQGDPALPRVLAGSPNWCVTDPKTMPVSVVADVPGAKSATITAVPPSAGPLPAPITVDLQQSGERISTGQGTLAVGGCAGLLTFSVRVADAQGQTLASNSFQAELVGAEFQRMRALFDTLKKRVDADQRRADLDPQAFAGASAWFTRVSAFVFNEARPEALNRALLAQMLSEYGDIDRALTAVEAGQDPYAGRTGSLVRAYRSPLTGNFRPLALYVPTGYDAKAGKAPLIVVLHSIFADERMLSLMTNSLKDLGAIVYQGAAYRQFDWGGVSAAETWAGLDEVKKHYAIDEERVYLIGYHIGGRGVWQLAQARPDQWAALAPIFSGIDTGPNYPALRLYPQWYSVAADVHIPNFKQPELPAPLTAPLERKLYEQASLVARAENIVALPIHGAYGEDDPNAAAERLALQQRLTALGNRLVTHYVPGAMHGSPANEFRDPAFYQWLLAQRRPPYPAHIDFAVSGLRDHAAWWVSVDQLTSPADIAHIDSRRDGAQLSVRTTNVAALTLLVDARLAPVGTALAVRIDGQPVPGATVGDTPRALHLVHIAGKWAAGTVPAGQKHPGLSGPLDDFQRDRFIFVYGTGGDEAERAALEKRGKRLADWGLGAMFTVKSDQEVTADDLRGAHLLLIGTPANNRLLAQMADRLPLRWTPTGIALGDVTVDGPGAGACCIVPNPLAPDHYAVVITATDDAGYQAWDARAPGGDYLLGRAETQNGKSRFVPTARGWFTNDWQWAKEWCLRE